MKKLAIPHLPILDTLTTADDIISRLDLSGARCLIDSLNWPEQYPYAPLTTVNIAHSGTALYIDFFVRSNYLRAVNSTDQSPVSQDSCVEFFVSPSRDNHYWNFEFNCISAINASQRSERHNPTRLTADQLARVKRYGSCGTRPFCEIEGIFTWNLLVVIPLDLIGVQYSGQPVTLNANFYKCASATSCPHYLSWNPIETPAPDFHRPEFFGQITLV
jgi:hypothetical protein